MMRDEKNHINQRDRDSDQPPKKRSRWGKFGRTDPNSPSNGGYILRDTNIDPKLFQDLLAARNPDLRPFRENHSNILTPGGEHQGKLLADLGPVTICDVRAKTPPYTARKKLKHLEGSYALFNKLVSPPKAQTKIMKSEITKSSLLCVQSSRKKGVQRFPRQDKAMSKPNRGRVSAKEYAHNLGFTTPKKNTWNWTHLVGHRFIGNKGQVPNNLCLATAECNTLMMFVEDEVSSLIKKMPLHASLVLTVTADCDEGHLARKIRYHIKAPVLEFEMTFCFYGQTRYRPQNNMADYFGALFDYARTTKQAIMYDTTPEKLKNTMDSVSEEVSCTPLRPNGFSEIFSKNTKTIDVEHSETENQSVSKKLF